MNNLKRVLGLGLVGTMLAGMLTMGASAADFTDAADIEHSEAVNVLVALDIVDGKPDGSFDPQGDVTRSQMAKMIAVAMNGGSEANTGVKTTPTYTDIKGHWAESYIEYCADLGIISGRGDGTFDPDANVTGLEATKMVLTAMGFDAAAYKLTGASWAVRTDEVARTMTGTGWTDNGGTFHSEPGMYDGLETVMMAANASRDTAAQLIWNGLQNRTRTVQPTTNTNSGSVEWTYITNGSTLLNQRYNANVTTDTFVGNYYTGDTSVKGEILVGASSIPSDFDISNIGEEVKVIWKDGTRGTKGQLDSKDVIFGVFNTGATRVVTGTLADVKDQKSAKAQINIGGTKYDLTTSSTPADDVVDVIVNYANQETRTGDVLAANGVKSYKTADLTNGTSSGNNTLTDDLKKSTGDTIKAIIDPDTNKITKIYVTTTKLAAVTAVNSEKITMNNNVGAIKFADNDVEEGLKKGDVVAVTVLYKAKATDDDAYTIVKKAETVEGEVSAWKESETVTVDGAAQKVYNKAATFMLTGTAIPDQDNTITTFKNTGNTYIGEEVILYMVNGYVGAAVQTSEAASNYSLVTEVKGGVSTTGGVFSGLELQVMDGEGKTSIIKVHKDSASGAQSTDYAVGDIITYTTTSDNQAKVTKEGAISYANLGAYDDEKKTFGSGASAAAGNASTLVTNDCIIFMETKQTGASSTAADMTSGDALLMSGAEYKVYRLRDLKSFGIGGTTATPSKGVTTVVNKDGKVVAAFVNYQGNPNGATDTKVYGIVSAFNGRIKDYYTYTVQSNGESYTVNIDVATGAPLTKGALVYFDKANDDNYGANDVTTVTLGAQVKAVWTKEAEATNLTYYTGTVAQDGNIKGIGQTTDALEKDAPIIYVDTKNDKSEAESSITAFDAVTGYANAIIIKDATSGKIKAIFVETSNEENINGVTPTQGALTATEIKNMEDGTFVPSDKTDLPSSAAANELRVFKFTGDGTCTNMKLTISDSTGVVYEETATLAADTDGHYFWVAVLKLDIASVSANVKSGSSWDSKTAAPAGSYTYTITGGTDGTTYGTTLSAGSFTI